MTAGQVIEVMYRSDELDKCIRKNIPADDRDDFKQELFLIIYELPEKTILELHKADKLRFYVVRIIINLARQVRNVYHKKYRNRNTVYVSQVHDNDGTGEETLRTNPWLREYLASFSELPDMEASEREQKEIAEQELLNRVNVLDETMGSPYYKTLVELITLHGSQRAVSRITGIPLTSICDAVKKVRNHLLTC